MNLRVDGWLDWMDREMTSVHFMNPMYRMTCGIGIPRNCILLVKADVLERRNSIEIESKNPHAWVCVDMGEVPSYDE